MRSTRLIPISLLLLSVVLAGSLGTTPANAGRAEACTINRTYCVYFGTGYKHLGCDTQLCRIEMGFDAHSNSTGYVSGAMYITSSPAGSDALLTGSCSLGLISCDVGDFGVVDFPTLLGCIRFDVRTEAQAGLIQPIYFVFGALDEALIACNDGTLRFLSV